MTDTTYKYWIDPRDKPGLLYALMKALVGANSFISFEGSLSHLRFEEIPDAQMEETKVLQRSTVVPELNFVVLPMTTVTVPRIWKIVSEKDHLKPDSSLIHTQIEKEGELVFGGYDNFHRECVMASASMPEELLQSLKECGTIRDYQKVDMSQHRWHD